MATMQGYISGQDGQLDELPSWKRDLILRKRANVRMHGGFGIPTPTSSMAGRGIGLMSGRPQLTSTLSGPSSSIGGPVSSIRGPHLPLIRSVSGPPYSHSQSQNNKVVSPRLEGAHVVDSDGDSSEAQKCVSVISENNSANSSSVHNLDTMHHKGLNDDGGPRVTSPTYSCYSDSCTTNGKENDEDFSYGPGIVSKLKNRYMSLAMRESRSRPSLRKFSSLEDLLDDPPQEAWPERRPSHEPKPRQGGHIGRMDSAAHRREVMKRARSVDSLSSRSGRNSMPKSKSATSRLQSSLSALQKDDVIIIEASKPIKEEPQQVNGITDKFVDAGEPPPLTRKMSNSNLLEEEEMPPPDTVRHVKKIFEPAGNRALRGTKARVAAHKAAQAANKASKPVIKAKPTDIPPRKVTPPTSTQNTPFPVTIEEAKSSLKHVAPVVRASPRSTLGVRATTNLNGDVDERDGPCPGVGVGLKTTRPGLTPVTASVTAPHVNGTDKSSSPLADKNLSGPVWVEEGVKKVSNSAVNNIRKESQSQDFNFVSSRSSATTNISTQSNSKHTVTKSSSPTPTPLPTSPVLSHRVPPVSSSSPVSYSPYTSNTEKESDLRVQQENLKNTQKSLQGGLGISPSKFNSSSEVNKVEPQRSPTKQNPTLQYTPKVDIVKSPVKVEPPKSSPPFPAKEPSSKSPTKPQCPQDVVLSPVEAKKAPSFIAEDLIRTPGKGNLVEAFNKQSAADVNNSPVLKPSNRDWRTQRAQDNNTLVFNFTSSKKEIPNHIENDGVDLSKRVPEAKELRDGYVLMPGWEGPRDSSTDWDDELGTDYLDARPGVIPPPSGILFEGEAVIINGRSNLQRQPKTKKLTISFDDAAQTYEYPSEASLIEEGLPISSFNTDSSSMDHTSDSSSPTTTHGGLASYTPSKIQIGSSFELGVSRMAPPVQASAPVPSVQPERVEEEYLRPADESETVTWSAESTSDMLF